MTLPDEQHLDLLSSGPEPERPHGRGRLVALVAAAGLAAGIAGGAVYAGTALSGGGAQPEDVLPASALGFVKVDLDPSAGQKLAAYRLAKKFPDSGVEGEGSIKDDLLRTVLGQEQLDDYDEDVRPWLGARAGVAFLAPTAAEPDEPVVVAAVQYTDRAEARAGLARLAEQTDEELHFAFAEGQDYVLLAQDQAVADDAARATEHLSGNPQFTRGVEALDGDQVALGWTDLAAVWKALPEQDRQEAFAGEPAELSGLAVFGAHVTDGTVEVLGRTLDVSAGTSPRLEALFDNPMGRGPSTGLVRTLPADSLGAFSATGLGAGFSALYDTFRDEVESDEEVRSLVEDLGITLPDDLETVLGTETALSVGGEVLTGEPRIGVRVSTSDPGRAVELVEGLRDAAAAPGDGLPQVADVDVREVDGGWAAAYGMDPADLTTGTLGDSRVFQRTLPDAATSGLSYYVDLAGALRQFDEFDRQMAQQYADDEIGAPPSATQDEPGLSEQERRNLEPLQAFGYTATAQDGGNATFRLRLTVAE